jgi:hypothetical protein
MSDGIEGAFKKQAMWTAELIPRGTLVPSNDGNYSRAAPIFKRRVDLPCEHRSSPDDFKPQHS